MTNTKGNEHPACGCRSCRRGAGSKWGQYMHTTVNRAIRRRNRAALKAVIQTSDIDSHMALVASTPYTD